jgi:DHA3 family macrolide efflux protein-like MFS transporter
MSGQAVKKNKTFYTLVVTQTFSMIGSRMTSIAVGFWVFARTGQASPLLLTSFFTELPGMLFGSLAGVVVDRWDRRLVMILADAGQAIGSLLLMISFLSGRFEIWHLYIIAFFQGTFSTFQGPAEDAATTMLVDETQRERANAIKQISFPLAGVIAPVLSGTLYAMVGIAGIIGIDLVTFMIAVTVALFVRIPHPQQTKEGEAAQGNFWRETLGAFRYLSERRLLLVFVVYMAFINFMLNGPLGLTLPYLISVTGSEAQAGGLMGVMSLGAFAGASLIAVWGGTRPRMHTLLPGLLVAGLMFLLYGTFRSPFLLGTSLFLILMPLPVMMALYMSIMQVKTPPDLQGRVFALVAQLGFLGSTASFALTGYLVDYVIRPAIGSPAWEIFEPIVGNGPGAGMGLVQVVTGIIILFVTLGVYGSAAVRQLEIRVPDYEAISAD